MSGLTTSITARSKADFDRAGRNGCPLAAASLRGRIACLLIRASPDHTRSDAPAFKVTKRESIPTVFLRDNAEWSGAVVGVAFQVPR